MRKSSIERLVGVGTMSEEEKAAALQEQFPLVFEDAKHIEIPYEIPKTSEQIELCRIIDERTRQMVLKYGGHDLAITPEHVRISEDLDGELFAYGSEAQFKPELQLILEKPLANDLEFAWNTAHEMLHFKSYGALQMPLSQRDRDDGMPREVDMEYRVGLQVASRTQEELFFHALEEGMTEELAKRLITELKQDVPQLQLIAEQTNTVLQKSALEEEYKEDIIYIDSEGHWKRFAYVEERKYLNLLIDKLFERNSAQFKDREEIFTVFAQAKFSGNILPLGRMIDETFGTGTFRALGEAYKGEQLERVVKSL